VWRRLGLTVDPLAGWEGSHGVAVRWSNDGTCQYRRPSRSLFGGLAVRRPGHPLAGSDGWVGELRMMIYDRWCADGRPPMRCRWCRTPLVWSHRNRTSRNGRTAALLAHPAKLDLAVGWTAENTVPACYLCAQVQRT
jgi:hypothetical protein